FITWAMLAFLVERAVCLGVALVRNRSGANITIERRGRKGRKAETVILSGLRGLCVLTSSRRTDVASCIDGRPIAGVRRVAAGSDPTRLFEAVYTQFQGIDVSDASPSCLQRVLVVTAAERLPLLLSAQLPAGWQSQRQYQRLVAFR